MALVSFPFHTGYPVVEVEFVRPEGASVVRRRLLVDSGFTGQSALVLPVADADLLAQGWATQSQTRGALSGRQNRAWVTCAVAAVGFRQLLLAICTDAGPLALPPGVDGLVGLTFLQRFTRWGGEQSSDGNWSFVLAAA